MDQKPIGDETAALIAQVRANAVRDGAPQPPLDTAQSYNFTRAGQISAEQMRAISTVNDLFARNLMHTLGAWLRTEFQVNAVAGEQLDFEQCTAGLEEPSYLCTVRLEPLGTVGLMEVGLSVALPIIELLLGGTGNADSTRALTDIEELILGSVVKIVVRELNSAWHPVGLQFNFEKRVTQAQAARTMLPGERTLQLQFETRMPEANGLLKLYLPAVVLSTTLRRLIEERDRPRRRPEEIRGRVRELVSGARLHAVLQTPGVRLRASEIAGLVPGVVLRIAVQKHVAAELRIAGHLYGKARPVRVGEHRGARMEPHAAAPEGE